MIKKLTKYFSIAEKTEGAIRIIYDAAKDFNKELSKYSEKSPRQHCRLRLCLRMGSKLRINSIRRLPQ